MNLLGIGIDVVETSRIESSISQFGDQFLSRIFTPDERKYCEKNKRAVLHYAARFAAKEAVSKALGTGIGKDVAFTEIEVAKKESGEPVIILHGKAKAFAQQREICQILISLTHAEHYAAANAVIMAK
ncbi:holo-ACP synthase [Akkermansiaceae bacterium]|nr:holo-ACP synthase [Akkermansiaceae bacterium]